MTGSTTCSTSAAITAPPASIEPPGPKPSRPGPRSLAWPLGHKPSWDRPSCALSRPEPIKLTVPMNMYPLRARLPRNLAEVQDRVHELGFGNRMRQDGATAKRVNDLVATIEALAALVP